MKQYSIIQYIFLVITILFQSIIFSQTPTRPEILSSEPFIAGEDGVLRMSINIIGHVRKPGTYMVYEGIDLLTALSLAGGYSQGANLKKILIKHYDGTTETINLKGFISNNENIILKLKPRDTIYINQKMFSKVFTSSNLPSLFLSILNIALTLERTD